MTNEMVATASNDIWVRYKISGTNIILYDLDQDDIGKPYKDGIDNDGDGESNGPTITETMIQDEILGNAIDDCVTSPI